MIDIDVFKGRLKGIGLGHRSNPDILSKQDEDYVMHDTNSVLQYNWQSRFLVYRKMWDVLHKLGYELKLFSLSGRNTSQPWILVYVKGDAYAAGVMRYNTIRESHQGERLWGWELVSRHFNNKRYRIHDKEFYHKTTTNCAKAVKLVKSGFRRWTAPEYAQLASNLLHRVKDNTAEKHNKQARDFLSEHLGCNDVLGYRGARVHQLDKFAWFNEFIHMHETGSFSNAEFGSVFAKCYEMFNESKRLKHHAETKTFTHVYVNHVLDRFECTTVHDYTDYWLSSKYNGIHEIEMADMTTSMYMQSDLPDHIMGAISTLSTLKDDEYVTGVGLRIAEDLYCVTHN